MHSHTRPEGSELRCQMPIELMHCKLVRLLQCPPNKSYNLGVRLLQCLPNRSYNLGRLGNNQKWRERKASSAHLMTIKCRSRHNLLTFEPGLSSNNPSLGGYSVVVPQEKILTVGIIGASNVLMTEASPSTANANANAIGLSASTLFTISMKSPKEVEITNFSVASQTLVLTLSIDVDTARQQGSAVQILEREPIISESLLHDVVKKLLAAAPAYKATPNGSSVPQPITFGRISGKARDVAKVPKGTQDQLSFLCTGHFHLPLLPRTSHFH